MDDDVPHILVVDDDTRLRALLNRYLADNGFRVTAAETAADARARLATMTFDLIVLDVMMPGESGIEFTRSLRQSDAVPILMLTAMGEPEDRINGLEGGVDDYLTKPFEPRELVLRIQTILRRVAALPDRPAQPAAPAEVRLGQHVFDPQRDLLLLDGTPVRLSTVETSLLKVLAAVPGSVLSRAELTRRCGIQGNERTVDVQVTRLRRKIEPDPKVPRYIQTVRGRGYLLQPD